MKRAGPWLVAFAAVFWAYYWIINRVAGPIGADELYFSHVFWLMEQGKRQFVDFYSYHLPPYFWLLSPLAGDDPSFIYRLRAVAVLVVGAYAAMTKPVLWPFVLLFGIFGRMGEIRPDTFGLLLMNAGWLALIHRRVPMGVVLAGLSLLFSARAVVVLFGFLAVGLYIAKPKERWQIGVLALAGLGALGLVFLAFPDWLTMVVRWVYLVPGQVMPPVSMATRLFGDGERAILVAMLAAGTAAAAVKRDPVFLGGCLTQWVLLAVDPAPYVYVYGWAMIPVVYALLTVKRWLPVAAFVATVPVIGAALLYPVWKGGRPHVTSMARLTVSTRLVDAERMTTDRLAQSILKPDEMWNQIAVRRELCRRLDRPVAVYFWYHPVCVHDAAYDWIGITWTQQSLERLVLTKQPSLIMWGDKKLEPHLPNSYRSNHGFAIRSNEDERVAPNVRDATKRT